MRKSVIALLGIVFLLLHLWASDKTSTEILTRGMIFHNQWIYSVKMEYPDFGSMDYRREIERTWRMSEKTFSMIKGKDIFYFTFNPSKPKKITQEKINIESIFRLSLF